MTQPEDLNAKDAEAVITIVSTLAPLGCRVGARLGAIIPRVDDDQSNLSRLLDVAHVAGALAPTVELRVIEQRARRLCGHVLGAWISFLAKQCVAAPPELGSRDVIQDAVHSAFVGGRASAMDSEWDALRRGDHADEATPESLRNLIYGRGLATLLSGLYNDIEAEAHVDDIAMVGELLSQFGREAENVIERALA